MGAGDTAIALFKVSGRDPKPVPGAAVLTMRHFAFRVDRKNFTAAREGLRARNIRYHYQHHGISESIYFQDPDEHTLEITTYEVED